jgi:tRNA dimethylallyltransferase
LTLVENRHAWQAGRMDEARAAAGLEDARPRAVFLMGPTASGKTAFALEAAERHDFALVSVDSALVYRGMDIGTAKPDPATLARHPHRLVDIRDPEETYSAADFRQDAFAAMQAIKAEGRIALLVGGTGLYFRALERGLSALPPADPLVRADIEQDAARLGWAALHARLAAADPRAAARIHANDPQRIGRALEVLALTGRPLSEQQGTGDSRPPYRILKLVAAPDDRAILHARIARRFRSMMQEGFLDELRRLRERPGLTTTHPAMRAVGYRQLAQHLNGELGLDEAVERAIFATRQLARRQLTWLRGEHDAFRFDPTQDPDRVRIERIVAGFAA